MDIVYTMICTCVCTCKCKPFRPTMKKYKKGEAMEEDGDNCYHCESYGSIQVSVDKKFYWCRKCEWGGTVGYAMEDSKE